jgi:uncharacterized membrane protein YedE/YeeE
MIFGILIFGILIFGMLIFGMLIFGILIFGIILRYLTWLDRNHMSKTRSSPTNGGSVVMSKAVMQEVNEEVNRNQGLVDRVRRQLAVRQIREVNR